MSVLTLPRSRARSAGRPPKIRQPLRRRMGLRFLIAWVCTMLFVAPALWTVWTSFHSEIDAVSNPPAVTAPFTLENYRDVLGGELTGPFLNSLLAALFSTILVIVLAVPAAFALSLRRVEKWQDVMFFFLSTKMMPAVAGLLPMYLIIKQLGLLDNVWTLAILYLSANLPIGIWMLRSFFNEIPRELLEAAQLDGAGWLRILRTIVAPLTYPGIAAASLIAFIFAWNEFLFALNLTATRAYTSPVYLIGFLSGQRLFLAHLCAVSTILSLPVLIAGYAAQDRLVQGLSLGAVK
jgi:sorbitol/mannitol transport system permease protein